MRCSPVFLRSLGPAVFQDDSALLLPDTDRTSTIDLGDVDGDGFPDVYVGNDASFSADRLYLNQAGVFFADASDEVAQPFGDRVFEIALVDLERDGDLDLLAGRGGPNRVYTNLGLQLTASVLPRVGKLLPLDHFGDPLAGWLLAVSTGPGSFVLPGLGTIYLDPTNLVLVASGSLDALGRDTAFLAVPADPTLAGVTVHWQAVHALATSLRFTNREATLLPDV